jgi:hypothetical protein
MEVMMTQDKRTTPCAVCAAQAEAEGSAFFATRGLDWPLTEVAGRQVHKACASDAVYLVRAAADGALIVDGAGVGRWAANWRAIPGDCVALAAALGLAPGIDADATAAASAVEAAAAVARYRAAQPAQASAGEAAEMRAAFGPGADVADVLTGRRTRL